MRVKSWKIKNILRWNGNPRVKNSGFEFLARQLDTVYYDRNGNFKDDGLYTETRWVYRDNKLLNDVRDIVFNRKEENENE